MSRRKRIWRRIGLVATGLLGVVALLVAATAFAFYQVSNVPRPEDIPQKQVATIEFADGSTLARIGPVDRTIVPLSQVSDQVKWAVLAAEDRNFYSEPGVSVKGTVRAALSDLTGGNTQGGSGITQQYVKNAYLSSAQTLSRKFKELAIAVKLSREYSKDQILEFYLNTVYFGRGAYGIEAAAEVFFNTTAAKLDTAQAALLAGMLQAPTYYDPSTNVSGATTRWNYVLDGMVTTKHLSAAARTALTFPPTADAKAGNGLGVVGPDSRGLIVQRVLAELEATDGISEDEIYSKGLIIKTTIDPTAQVAAESAISTTFANLTAKQQNIKNSLTAVNPATGAVLAYYGGASGSGYDYANGCRPAGSSFKPYTLATALSQTLQNKQPGYTIKSLFNGSQTVVIDGTPISNDPSDKGYSGITPLDFAMKVSLNTTFDGLAYAVGPSNVAATAHAAGIPATCGGQKTLQDADGTTSFGIGIGDYPVHPLDQAVGFATLENGGVLHNAYFVSQVTTRQGSVLYTHKDAAKQAIDSRVANDVTLTLEPVASFSSVALAGGRASASKTGTVGIEASSGAPPSAVGQNSDAWMVGFTPQVSASVWVGSGSSTAPVYDAAGREEYGRDLPGRTWKLFMDTYLAKAPKAPLPTKQLITGFPGASASVSATPSTTTPTTSAPPSSSVAPAPGASSTPPPSTSSTPPAPPTRTTPAPPTSSSSAGPIVNSISPSG